MKIGDMIIKIVAIDFDGTITKESKWPELGEFDMRVVNAIKVAKSRGVKFILWTNRQDDNTFAPNCLTEAVDYCKTVGITFDAVNDNLPEIIEYFGPNTRKITADYYVDDKSPGSIEWFLNEFGDGYRLIQMLGTVKIIFDGIVSYKQTVVLSKDCSVVIFLDEFSFLSSRWTMTLNFVTARDEKGAIIKYPIRISGDKTMVYTFTFGGVKCDIGYQNYNGSFLITFQPD